jgi:Sec-independent protein translocase protein TatA
MEFLGIGPMELLFIILIALILLGPKDMIKAARVVGGFITKVVRSEYWADIQQSMRMMRGFPYNLMRETGLEEDINSIKNITQTELNNVNQELLTINHSAQVDLSLETTNQPPNPLAADVLIETPSSPLGSPLANLPSESDQSKESNETPSL